MKLIFSINVVLQVGTTRVIYAWNEADPAGDDPNAVMYHGTNRGTRNLYLLGGQQEVPPDPSDLEIFDLTVKNVCTHRECEPSHNADSICNTIRHHKYMMCALWYQKCPPWQ